MNSNSSPSDLKITDMRVVSISGAPMRSTLIRLDTNQGIYGLGEVRDGASHIYALQLKRQLTGENPCNVDKVFRKIKQFGWHARQAGGVCGVEMALMDLAGKAHGVPCYQLAGGKFRDQIRTYCDTPTTPDAEEMGNRLKKRMDDGFTFLKMDIGVRLLKDIPGTVSYPAGMLETNQVMHPLTGIQFTDKGIEALVEYVETVRNIVGYEIPLAADHFGHINVESCIRLARALERFNLAWLEDMIPWELTDQWVRLKNATSAPVCTGEDIYLLENFKPLIDNKAVSVIHPDLASSGGILETKKIGDYAEENGIAMAMHMAATPIATMASVHCAAATNNFLVLECHAVDYPPWNTLVTGLPNPIIQNGYIQVPDTPGLGVDLNEEAIKEHINPDLPGYFESTEQWDNERVNDRLWS
ncbi:MAG: mandelate racemase/muconate lactonizing enzyme family protein [Candidatus Latescibacteria bacterium]|jgi:L-alanine-DL-glutamate epimerase-like enolase superfamily enzyme|nr:mandelate racemase/muconate lactonizing enzyme family protein [Candidatus Latescibacterota bacterium]